MKPGQAFGAGLVLGADRQDAVAVDSDRVVRRERRVEQRAHDRIGV